MLALSFCFSRNVLYILSLVQLQIQFTVHYFDLCPQCYKKACSSKLWIQCYYLYWRSETLKVYEEEIGDSIWLWLLILYPMARMRKTGLLIIIISAWRLELICVILGIGALKILRFTFSILSRSKVRTKVVILENFLFIWLVFVTVVFFPVFAILLFRICDSPIQCFVGLVYWSTVFYLLFIVNT